MAETVVVLVILGILACLLLSALTGYIRRAREAALIQRARQVYLATQTVLTEGYSALEWSDSASARGYLAENMDDVRGLCEEDFVLDYFAVDDFCGISAFSVLMDGYYCERTARDGVWTWEVTREPDE